MAIPVLTGLATLSPDTLVDSLVEDVIDGLREELHPDFGVRAYRVYRVVRSWSGGAAGSGVYTDDVAELRPQPMVHAWDGKRIEPMSCGLLEQGDIALTEVSLAYTYDQLTLRDTLTMSQQFFLAVGEAHGQGQPTVLYAHSKPPYCDRVKDMGWKLWLTKVEGKPVRWP